MAMLSQTILTNGWIQMVMVLAIMLISVYLIVQDPYVVVMVAAEFVVLAVKIKPVKVEFVLILLLTVLAFQMEMP